MSHLRTAFELGVKLAFEKEGVARWREAIYSGQLGPERANRLWQQQGVSPLRLAQGMDEGSMNTANRIGYNINFSAPSGYRGGSGSDPNKREIHLNEKMETPIDLVTPKVSPEAFQQERALVLRHEVDESREQIKKEQALAKKRARGSVPRELTADIEKSREEAIRYLNELPEESFQYGSRAEQIANMHRAHDVEIQKRLYPAYGAIDPDRRRIMQGYLNQYKNELTPFPPEEAGSIERLQKGLMTGNHAGPAVTIKEFRNANALLPEVQYGLDIMRGPKEYTDIRNAAGSQVLPKRMMGKVEKSILANRETERNLISRLAKTLSESEFTHLFYR